MPLSPRQLARKIEKWAAVGIDYATIEGARAGIEPDRVESVARAPHRSGALAGTIRVTTPSSRRAARIGFAQIGLSAGSASKANPVFYASVLQRGLVGYPGSPRTKPHLIAAHAAGWNKRWTPGRGWIGFESAGKKLQFVGTDPGKDGFTYRGIVKHPGSRFRARNYLRVTPVRISVSIDHSLQTSVDREIG